MNVAADAQGSGVGRFAVLALAEEARPAASTSSPCIWEPGEEGPEEFFGRIGFEVIGETQYGEKLGALKL